MAAKEDAIRAFKDLLAKYETKQEIFFALSGDGSGADTADVSGKIGWAWVRYGEEQSKVSQVFNPTFPGIPGNMPIIVGKKYPSDQFVQILGVNQQLYWQNYGFDTIEGYLLPAHGQSHNAAGSDPAMIDTKNIVPGLVHQTDPDSLEVTVEAFRYIYQTSLLEYGGGNIDLSGVTPASGNHQYALLALIPSTGAIRTTESGEYSLPVTPTVPTMIAGDIPLSVVDVRNGENIVNAYIHDYRVLFQDAGGSVLESVRQLAYAVAELDFALSKHIVEG